MHKILLLIAVLFLSTACSNKTKSSLGLTEKMPDEYQVKRNKALEVPPHYKPSGYTGRDAIVRSQGSLQRKESLSESEEALLKEVK